MILYDYWRSSASYRVRIALNLKQLDYRQSMVDLAAGMQTELAHLRRNPQGLVPVLEHEGTYLDQSLAICEYLDEAFPDTHPLLPGDCLGRARVRSLAQLVACEIHPLNNLRVLQYLQGELGLGEEQKLTWYRHWLRAGLSALETRLEQDPQTGSFCHGSEPGLADLCLIPQLYNARRFECPLGDFPTLVRIDHACQSLPAFVAAHPDHHRPA